MAADPIVASVSSCRGDSTTSSLAPRGLIMSNMPTPSRTSSHSIRKYASGSGTIRSPCGAASEVTHGARRWWLVLDLALELSQVLACDVDPVLFGRQW